MALFMVRNPEKNGMDNPFWVLVTTVKGGENEMLLSKLSENLKSLFTKHNF